MEDRTSEEIRSILTTLSELTGTEVKFEEGDQGRLQPIFDFNAIISKLFAVMVFCGITMNVSGLPPYNRVHADVEWWKSRFKELDQQAEPNKE